MTKLKKAPPPQTPFFVVWNPERRSPTYKHDTLTSATYEAERLACQNPGTFYVLACVGSAAMTTLETKTFPFDRDAEWERQPSKPGSAFDSDLDDDVPF